jgi:hypothetical protein
MESFKQRLTAETAVCRLSVGQLTIGRKYDIELLSIVNTKFGRSILAKMKAGEDRRVECYLPKAVTMSDEEIENFNNLNEKDLKFIFLGMRGNAFLYNFI